MTEVAFHTVLVQKADLDTVCAGYLLGATTDHPVAVVNDVAPQCLLDDPAVLCLECGGAGEVAFGNFDHHDPLGPVETASEQAWAAIGRPTRLARLVEYVSRHDRGLTEDAPDRRLSLVGMFSAMREVLGMEDVRFRSGLSLMRWFVSLDCDPRGPLATLEQSAPVVGKRGAYWSPALADGTLRDAGTTAGGRRLAVAAEGTAIGLRQLYTMGFQVVIAESTRFGVPPRRRLTIALDPQSGHVQDVGVATERIRSRVNALEAGWGGPAGGTILGSPRNRSSTLALDDLVTVCREEG